MKSSLQMLVISVVVSLTGCVSVNIQSNAKADAKPAFRRILIESRLPKMKPTYLPTFQKGVSGWLSGMRGIQQPDFV